jgi:hypothetical protein
MLELAQVALLDNPIHVLAVVLEDRRQVLLNGDGLIESGLRCHEDSILRIAGFRYSFFFQSHRKPHKRGGFSLKEKPPFAALRG